MKSYEIIVRRVRVSVSYRQKLDGMCGAGEKMCGPD